MTDAETAAPSTSEPVVAGDVARALAPLVEHLRDACIFVDYDMRVGFLNAVARRDIQSRGDDPNRYPGRPLWDVIPHAPDALTILFERMQRVQTRNRWIPPFTSARTR